MNLVNKSWTVQSCPSSSNLGFGPSSTLYFQAGQNPGTYDINILGGGTWAACSETAAANNLQGTYLGGSFDINYQAGSPPMVTCCIHPAAPSRYARNVGTPDITWTAVDTGVPAKSDPCVPPHPWASM